jgi:hypothetical protein
MTQAFRESTIEKICNVEYGTRVVRKKDAGTIYPVYGGGGETFFLDTFNRENRVVVARFAMSEKCTRRVLGKFALNDSGLTLSPKDASVMRQDYLDYFVLSINNQIYESARGTAQKNLDVPAFRQMKVVYPTSLEKQREIVEKLDKAFVEIDLLEVRVDENIRRILEIEASLISNLFAKYSERLDTKTLVEVAEYVNGSAHEKIVDSQGTFKIINSKFISTNGLKFKRTSKQLSPLIIGDVAMVLSDVPNGKALAKCFLVDENNTYSLNQRICKLSSKTLLPNFLFLNMNRNPYLLSFNNGENQTNLRLNDVLKTPILEGDFETQQLIIDEFKEARMFLDNYSDVIAKKISKIVELRQSLLGSAFTIEEMEVA